MKRKMNAREWMLLGVLAVLAIVCGYIALFYMPTTEARDNAIAEKANCEQQLVAVQERLAEKQRMERELDEIFAANPNPLSLPDYDNVQPVMKELNTVLAGTDYDLSFASVDASETVVRRQISVSYSCDSYAAAKQVLERLNNSQYRCMLNDISISGQRTEEGAVSIRGTIVYFECQEI